MCGIVGLVAKTAVNQSLFDALTVLQHRGQDAAGIATCDDKQRLHSHKGNGLVRDVMRTRHIMRLTGHAGIGHVRYPTAGSASELEAQPFYVNAPYGIMLVHNGNLTNADDLRESLWKFDRRHLSTQSDSEIILNVFATELQKLAKKDLEPDDIFTAVAAVQTRCRGAYAVTALIAGYGVVAFRDSHGIRPLLYGERQTEQGSEYMAASEKIALDMLGFTVVDDVKPGEAVFFSLEGQCHKQQCAKQIAYNPCLFEFVYLARPDSVMDQISVYKVRLRLGEYLAEKIKREHPEHDIDVVMPIPDTSRTAASTLARQLGVKFREGFVKNRYIGRTFIMAQQDQRRKSVRRKLNTIPLEFKDKNVLLVDDSIVRGTTAHEIVDLAREAGAKKVYFASAAPEVKYPNVYGIDMPVASELIAHDRSVDDICKEIGADWLIYQDLGDLVTAAREGNPSITRFEDSVFTGDYVTGDIDTAYLKKLEQQRNDAMRIAAEEE